MAVHDDLTRLGSERLARLAAVARELVSELRLDDVLDHLLTTARELTGARYAALGVLNDDGDGLARFATSGVDEEQRRLIGDPPHGRGVLGVLIKEPRPLRLHDVATDPRAYGAPTHHPPMTTFLGVPVVVRGAVWGNLYLTDKAGGADFDDTDEQTAVMLARWSAIAIENAGLYETLDDRRAELERANASLLAMTEITAALGAETDLAPVLDLIVKRARALVAATGVLVLLPEGDDLVVAASAGRVAPITDRIPIAGTRSGDVLTGGEAVRIDDVPADTRFQSRLLGAPEATSALLVPMRYRRKVVGVLVAVDRRRGDPAFRRRDEELLASFAASAATAVVTAQSVEVERLRAAMRAAEAERGRWARELHDDTLQSLGGLEILLESAAALPGGGDGDAQLRSLVALAAERVGDEIAALRSLIAELRPTALDELGLGPALQGLVRRVAGGEGLDAEAEIDLDGAADLSPELETTVYRVAQEALTNVARHADARRVELRVTRSSDALSLCVADDGAGFAGNGGNGHGDADDAQRFGLAGMRERVVLAGGDLQVDTAPTGTTVRARFPLQASVAPSSSPRSSA